MHFTPSVKKLCHVKMIMEFKITLINVKRQLKLDIIDVWKGRGHRIK